MDGASVLVVDDEPLNRALMRAALGASCKVLEAESGPQALEVICVSNGIPEQEWQQHAPRWQTRSMPAGRPLCVVSPLLAIIRFCW